MSCPRIVSQFLVAALLAQGPLLAGPRPDRFHGQRLGPAHHSLAISRVPGAPVYRATPRIQAAPRVAPRPYVIVRPPLAGAYWVPPAWGWGFGWGYDPAYWGYYDTAREGRVQIKTNRKDAVVKINGAYAGTAGELKTIWLEPGKYDFELRVASAEPYETSVYVLAGKTIKLRPEFEPES